jgi:hypothetical protein
MLPTPNPNQDYLTSGALPLRLLPRILASLGPGPQNCYSRGFAPWAPSPLPWPPDLDTPVIPPSWLQHECKNDLWPLLDHTVAQWPWITLV